VNARATSVPPDSLRWVVALLLVASAGCSLDRSPDRADGPPAPDVSQMEPKVAQVLEDSRHAVLREPESAESWGKLGAVFDVHGLFEEAETCYRRARGLAPDDFRWAYFLAIVRDVRGAEAEELVRLFGEAIDLRPDYAPAHFRSGYALSLRGALDEAEQAYRKAIAIDAQLALAHRDLGSVMLARGEPRAALEPLLRAAELAPRDGSVYSTLAQVFRQTGQDDAAVEAANRASLFEPINDIQDPVAAYVATQGTSSMHWVARARKQIDAGDYARALVSLRVLREILPDDAHTFYLTGSALARLGRGGEAEIELVRALELDPDHAEAHVELGRLYEAGGRLDAARSHYLDAQALGIRDPGLLVSLAQVLSRSGDDHAAVEIYEKLDPGGASSAPVQSNWGNALMRLQRNEAAVERFRVAIGLDPRYANAHFNMGVVLERLGRPDEALTHYEAAARISPGHAAEQHANRLRRKARPGQPGSPGDSSHR